MKLKKVEQANGDVCFINPSRITFISPQTKGEYLIYLDAQHPNGKAVYLPVKEAVVRELVAAEYVVGTL